MPPERAEGTHFPERHGTKTNPGFLPADGEAFWSLFLSSFSLLLGGFQCNQKTPIPVSSRRESLGRPKKDKHQH